jgi:hypothetical protein
LRCVRVLLSSTLQSKQLIINRKMKKVIIAITAVVAGVIVFSANTTKGHGNPSGAPAAAAGAPNDGGTQNGTCAKSGCHNGTTIAQADMITSNVPNTGYVAGQTYTITATITAANKVRFGFEISPQNGQRSAATQRQHRLCRGFPGVCV